MSSWFNCCRRTKVTAYNEQRQPNSSPSVATVTQQQTNAVAQLALSNVPSSPTVMAMNSPTISFLIPALGMPPISPNSSQETPRNTQVRSQSARRADSAPSKDKVVNSARNIKPRANSVDSSHASGSLEGLQKKKRLSKNMLNHTKKRHHKYYRGREQTPSRDKAAQIDLSQPLSSRSQRREAAQAARKAQDQRVAIAAASASQQGQFVITISTPENRTKIV